MAGIVLCWCVLQIKKRQNCFIVAEQIYLLSCLLVLCLAQNSKGRYTFLTVSLLKPLDFDV